MSRPAVDDLVSELRLTADLFADGEVEGMNGDAISALIVRLAAQKTYLGEYVAAYQRDSDVHAAAYDHAKELAFKDAKQGGATDKASDNAKRLAASDLRDTAIKAKYQAALVTNLWRDTDKLIETLRSRLSYLKTEKDS